MREEVKNLDPITKKQVERFIGRVSKRHYISLTSGWVNYEHGQLKGCDVKYKTVDLKYDHDTGETIRNFVTKGLRR